MKVPAELYTRSPRVYRGLEDLTYPFHDATFTVTHCGRICFHGRKINLSHVFAGQNVGVTQVGDHLWLVTFMHYDLGFFDDEACRLEPIANPFGPGDHGATAATFGAIFAEREFASSGWIRTNDPPVFWRAATSSTHAAMPTAMKIIAGQ